MNDATREIAANPTTANSEIEEKMADLLAQARQYNRELTRIATELAQLRARAASERTAAA